MGSVSQVRINIVPRLCRNSPFNLTKEKKMLKLLTIAIILISTTAYAAGLDVGCLQRCMESGTMYPVCKRQCEF